MPRNCASSAAAPTSPWAIVWSRSSGVLWRNSEILSAFRGSIHVSRRPRASALLKTPLHQWAARRSYLLYRNDLTAGHTPSTGKSRVFLGLPTRTACQLTRTVFTFGTGILVSVCILSRNALATRGRKAFYRIDLKATRTASGLFEPDARASSLCSTCPRCPAPESPSPSSKTPAKSRFSGTRPRRRAPHRPRVPHRAESGRWRPSPSSPRHSRRGTR